MSDPTPILIDAAHLRSRVRAKTVNAIAAAFPLDMRQKRLEVKDLRVVTKDVSPHDEWRAQMTSGTIEEAVKGTLVLKDLEGNVLSEAKNFTLAHVPWMTDRHTLIAGGNEYQVANQLRRKPGVYTTRAENGEVRSVFNLGRGKNFDLGFDPGKGTFHLEYGTSNIPLYPVLRALGVSHERIASKLGEGVAQANALAHKRDTGQSVSKLYAKLEHPSTHNPSLDAAGKADAVRRRYEMTTLDPHVTKETLGNGHEKVTPDALLDAAHKILGVHAGTTVTDDTDALAYKTFHSIDDFLAERVRLSARAWGVKAKFALASKNDIREALRPAPFSDGLRKFVTTSSLTAVPTGINPLELLDHSVKVTSLGDGGIPSDRAIPLDARMIHNTHFGALDPIRTPESNHSGVDIRATIAAHRDEAGNLYTVARNVRTGKVEYLKAGDLKKYVVAFPGQALKGRVDAFVKGVVAEAPHSTVTHQIDHVGHLYSPATTLIPMIHSIQGNRAIMGSKMGTQALPLVEREAPFVQVKSHLPGDVSYEAIYGHVFTPTAPVDGTVHKIENGWIYIKPDKPHAKTAELGVEVLEKTADRPTKSRRKLGPHTFNIEIQKGEKPFGKAFLNDYGYLPGYEGPDGDSLDFWVGQDPAGALAVCETYQDGAHADTKYMVGIHRDDIPAQVKQIEQKPGVECKDLTYFDSWDDLDASIERFRRKAEKAAEIVKIADETHEKPKWYFHGSPVENDESIARHGLLVREPAAHNMASIGPDDAMTALPRTDAQKRSVHFTSRPSYAAIYGKFDGKGVYQRERHANVYAMEAPVDDAHIRAKSPEGSYAPGYFHTGDSFLHEGNVAPEKLYRVRYEDGKFFMTPLSPRPSEKTAAKAVKDEDLVRVPYQQNFPMPSKTYLHHELDRKVGDKVRAGERMGESNYTQGGVLALGRNLRVAYVPYYGLNSNDAVVISEGCAKKLTSEHMYREVFPLNAHVELSRGRHQMYYGTKYTAQQYGVLDESGVVRKGSIVHHKDPLVLGLVKTQLSGTDAMLGRISKSLSRPYQEVALTWSHGSPGTVIDVIRTASQIAILIKTHEQMQVGDKLAGRYGNKGVVARILPDHEMLQDEAGHPIDLLLTSAGVVSRINPAQVIETALGKVVEKTGKPILYDNNAPHNALEWAEGVLKKHGVKDKEELFDPIGKRKVKGADGAGVLVGRQFIYKLFKSTDTNFSAHGVGPYDLNRQPQKTGGEESAKGFGKMEFDALVAHNARNFLREAATVKGQKNDAYWKAVQLGMPLPEPKPSFAFEKFVGLLEGAGLKVDKRGSKFKLLPMTDRDTAARSTGAIQNSKTLVAKNLKPETGGLFDPRLTGGPEGTLYAHIDLHEPIPNPVFKEPVRRLLGLTDKAFHDRIGTDGGKWFHNQLKAMDVPAKLRELKGRMVHAKGAELNDVVKQIKYLNALQAEGLKPHEAYVVSKVPVIPPVFRPITPQPNDPTQLMVADANKLYGHLMDSNHTLHTTAVESDRAGHRKQVYNAVAALYGTEDVENDELRGQSVKGFLTNIAGSGTPKGGFFQRKLMRMTQDVSGRGTAVPDANLGMDEVGIPEKMLWGMYDKLLVARLVRSGYPALMAREMVNKKAPAAREALLAEARERPVLINRAPTLHRWSIVAAYAKPVPGQTIRVNPFIEKGMNLDYDGDTLQVHAPVGHAAVEDTRRMTLSNMLMSDQTHSTLMAFPQHEAIIGFTHAAKAKASGKSHDFESDEHVVSAWRRGEIGLNDTVHMPGEKRGGEGDASGDDHLCAALCWMSGEAEE